MTRHWLRLTIGGRAGVGAIQLVPYGHDHVNPPVVSEPGWDSAETRRLAQRACFDCHSNETIGRGRPSFDYQALTRPVSTCTKLGAG